MNYLPNEYLSFHIIQNITLKKLEIDDCKLTEINKNSKKKSYVLLYIWPEISDLSSSEMQMSWAPAVEFGVWRVS